MKAITLYQPWATLMAIDEKHNETRSWYAFHRGELAIHAGKTIIPEAFELFRPVLEAHGYTSPEQLPTGCIVAVVHMEHCTYIDEYFAINQTERERSYGDYTVGRFAWRTKDAKALPHPVMCRGAQGLWYVPHEVELAIREQLEVAANERI